MAWRFDWDDYSWAYMEYRNTCHLIEREKGTIMGICGVSAQWHDSDMRWRIAPPGMRQCLRCIWTIIRWERDNAEVVHGSSGRPAPFTESPASRYVGKPRVEWADPCDSPSAEAPSEANTTDDGDADGPGEAQTAPQALGEDRRLRNSPSDRFRGFGSDLRRLR